ncbi:unnamed protein product [Prorocentrum cordatum]|uniref:non-specific serine/threonine protein kinase n=1 Tax=Prorocentrum cordatum TaxID=2364126 RepID=A0ABN9SV47_9DINO|nr:unnamed protein product [Polarella glacialis]
MAWLWSGPGRGTTTIDGHQVTQGQLLADGGFAYVYRGSDLRTGEPVAIRRVLLQDAQSLERARTEIAILRRLPPQKNVVRFVGAEIVNSVGGAHSKATTEAVSLFELCNGGTLLARLERAFDAARPAIEKDSIASFGIRCCCPCLPEAEAVETLAAMSSALAHVHSYGIVHYDVKSENILLGLDGVWKLADFGSASVQTFELAGASRRKLLEVEEFVHGRCTPIYRPPELADVHLRWPIGSKVDVFALGCVLYATLTGVHPFPMDSALANIQAKFAMPSEAESAYAPALPAWARRTLAREPGSRPSAAELVAEVERFRVLADGDEIRSGAAGEARCSAPTLTEDPGWVADFSFAPAPLNGTNEEAAALAAVALAEVEGPAGVEAAPRQASVTAELARPGQAPAAALPTAAGGPGEPEQWPPPAAAGPAASSAAPAASALAASAPAASALAASAASAAAEPASASAAAAPPLPAASAAPDGTPAAPRGRQALARLELGPGADVPADASGPVWPCSGDAQEPIAGAVAVAPPDGPGAQASGQAPELLAAVVPRLVESDSSQAVATSVAPEATSRPIGPAKPLGARRGAAVGPRRLRLPCFCGRPQVRD